MDAEINNFFGTTEVEIVRDDDGNKIRVSLYDNSVVMLLEKEEKWKCKYCTLTDDTFKLQQIDQILGPVSILTVNKLKNIEFFSNSEKLILPKKKHSKQKSVILKHNSSAMKIIY